MPQHVYPDVLRAIGHTPIVKLNKIGKHLNASFYVKLEFLNPGGSIKDRIALHIIEKAEKEGKIKPGGTIVEATSGNTGMGLAVVAAVKGYQTVFVMPDKMSQEKVETLRAFGAKVIITPTNVEPEDPRSYYSVAKKIAMETPNAFYANQYHNQDNPEAHFYSTGPEIMEQTDGDFDYFVAGMGTGGTISGTTRYLKSKKPQIKSLGVDPIGSMYYDKMKHNKDIKPHSYFVEGIGEDFYPTTMDFKMVDDVIQVNDKECMTMTRRLLREEGIFGGMSCGAAVAGAVKHAEQTKEAKKYLIILPDSGFRYLSKVYNDTWLRENGFIEYSQGSVKDMITVLNKRHERQLLSVDPDKSVAEVVELMEKHGFSHIPVVRKNKIYGVVGESDLLAPLLAQKISPNSSIGLYAKEKEMVSIELGASVEKLPELIKQSKMVLVMNEGQLVDVLTQIDLITYFSLSQKPV